MNEDDLPFLKPFLKGAKVQISDFLKDSYGTPARPIWDIGSPSVAVEVPPVEKLKDMLEKAGIAEDVAEDTGHVASAISYGSSRLRRIEVKSKVTLEEKMRLAGPAELNWELARERIIDRMLNDLVKALDESGLTTFKEVADEATGTTIYLLSIDVVANE